MPSPLSRAEVERIAALARLELTEAEKDLFAAQLAEILAYAQEIQQVDTTGIPPTSHVLARHGALRPDDPSPSLAREEALANAPDPASAEGLFKVPRVIG